MLRKPENKEWSRGVINRFNAAVFGTAERNTPQQQLPEDVPAEVQPSWEDDIMAKLGDFHVGGSQHANFDSEPGILSTPNQSGPSVLTTHGPVASAAVDTAFSSQFTNVPSYHALMDYTPSPVTVMLRLVFPLHRLGPAHHLLLLCHKHSR